VNEKFKNVPAACSNRQCIVPRAHNAFGNRSFNIVGPSTEHRPTPTATGYQLQALQVTTKNISVWDLVDLAAF